MVAEEGTRTADIVAESLLDWGVDTIFGLPGDGINGFIEALRRRKDKIRFVLVRHEESASFMACPMQNILASLARVSQRPGLVRFTF